MLKVMHHVEDLPLLVEVLDGWVVRVPDVVDSQHDTLALLREAGQAYPVFLVA